MDRTKEAERLLKLLGGSRSGYALSETAYAVNLAMTDGRKLRHVTKGFYQEIAREYRTDWRNIEKNIRTVRDTIWNSGERKLRLEIIGWRTDKRPTNTELLKILSRYLLCMERMAAELDTAASSEFNIRQPSLTGLQLPSDRQRTGRGSPS